MNIFCNFFLILLIQSLFPFRECKSVNSELVFLLRKHYRSNHISIASNDNYDINLLKKFYVQTHAFVHLIDFNSRNFSKNFRSLNQDIMVVADGKSSLIEKLIESADDHPDLMSSAVWIYFIEEDIVESIEKLYIPYNCEFLIVKKIDDFNYEMEEVYQISKDHPKIYSRFGIWKNGILEVSRNDFFKRRMDLKGHQFNLAETFLKQYIKKYHQVWELFAEAMNFSINYDPRDNGILFPNGTKTGIMELLADRKIDGTAHPYLYTNFRAEHFDYIYPTMFYVTRFYLQENAKLNWTSYIAPFSAKVWLSILLSMIISSIVVYIINRTNRRTISEASYFIIIKALLNQAGLLRSSSASLYISYITPYFLAFILTQYYTGVLLSYLTIQVGDSEFKTVEDLVQDGSYKASTLNGTALLMFLYYDPDPLAKAVREKKLLVEPDKLPLDTYTAFDQICENRWIYIGRSSDSIIKAKCRITELNNIIFKDWAGMMVYKGFPYKEVMIRLLKKFQFAGIIKLYQKDVIYSNDEADVFKPFSLHLFFPLLLLYLIFIILSLLILLLEFMCKE